MKKHITSGHTREEKDEIAAWSGGPPIFQHFLELQSSLRISDYSAYLSARGFPIPPVTAKTIQVTPLTLRDERVGIFFLAGKADDQEFTAADEDVLQLLASQAATAIANARTHRNEQRARADLETLIETSPVGVVVFDGKSAEPTSFNREARRIVEKLQAGLHSPEELLRVITCRRSDGREIPLAELPMSRHLNDPETVHAEEMTLSLPNGRSVTTLVNATPIRAADGAVESMVVILQDLAPLEELTRLRAEILGKVSDELRAPLVAIKGSSVSVLSSDPRPDLNEMLQYFRVIDEKADQMREVIRDFIEYGRIATGTLELNPIATNVSTLIERGSSRFRNEFATRGLTVNVGSAIRDVYVDSDRVEQTIESLLYFISRFSDFANAIEITALQEDTHIAVSMSTRNWSVPSQQITHLFQRYSPPLSDAGDLVSNVTGVDLAICRGLIEANGGRIWATSDPSQDRAQITFTLPLADVALPATGQSSTAAKQVSSASEPSRKLQLLVVDVTPYMRRYIQESFANSEFELVFVDYDEQLSAQMESLRPELVILDIEKHEFAPQNKIAELAEMFDVPVLVIASDSLSRSRRNGGASGRNRLRHQTFLTVRIGSPVARSSASPSGAGSVHAR